MQKYYMCAVCGKEHESILARAQCEEKCVAAAEKAIKEKQLEKLLEQRKESEQEIHAALSDINEMVAKHFEKYHSLSLNQTYPYLQHIFSRSRWLF